MTVKLLYFAHLRETLGLGGEDLSLPDEVADVAALRTHLAGRGDVWQVMTLSQNLRAAVNQQMAGPQTAIADGDEIAFFPPVTGG